MPSAPLRVYWPSHHLRHMTRSELDARIASGEFTVTKLPTRKARKSELVFSMTKGLAPTPTAEGRTIRGTPPTPSRQWFRVTLVPTSKPQGERANKWLKQRFSSSYGMGVYHVYKKGTNDVERVSLSTDELEDLLRSEKIKLGEVEIEPLTIEKEDERLTDHGDTSNIPY